MDSAIDWKEKQLTKRVKFQSELTELKARDTSCPRGKKVELKIIRTIGICEGGIFECAVADALYKKGYQLYFYKNETTKKEIDVIIQKDGKVVPIEVKSGNTRANSLKSIMKNNKDISYGYKFIDGNVGTSEEGIITLPLYMIAFFDKVSE